MTAELDRPYSSAVARRYTAEEAERVGLFSLGVYEGGFGAVGTPGDLVIRPDLT